MYLTFFTFKNKSLRELISENFANVNKKLNKIICSNTIQNLSTHTLNKCVNFIQR